MFDHSCYIGPDNVRYTLRGDSTNQPVDEIADYWKARYLTATESSWRILGYHLAQKEPSVTPLPIHLPGDNQPRYVRANLNDAKSLLRHYFLRPNGQFTHNGQQRSFDDLSYADYYTLFRLTTYDATRASNPVYFEELHSMHSFCETHVIQRQDTNNHLTRIQNVRPSQGEIFYLRCILQHKPVRSFEDARTVNGTILPNFQLAAMASGLFADENEAVYALQEAVHTLRTPRQIRLLFVHLLINDCIPSPIQVWQRFRDHLSLDFFLRNNNNLDTAITRTLQQISNDLEEHGYTLNDYGLPQPTDYNDEVEHELQRWVSNIDNLRTSANKSYALLDSEQRELYDRIMYAIYNGQGLCQFIDGKAGRGKTFLVNALCDRLRSQKKIVLATATSAFAAQQYPGGRTTHSTFKVTQHPLLIGYNDDHFA